MAFNKIPFSQLDAANKAVIVANAAGAGMTPEQYYDYRGGINKSGYYGDSYVEGKTLTDEEYAAALAKGGGSAINAASAAKQGYTASSSSAGSSTATPTTALYKATDGKTFTDKDSYLLYQQNLDTKKQNRQSAYDLLYNEFKSYGLESLVADIKGLIEKDVPDSQFTLELRNSPKYQARFSANADRVNKGLRALNEATYLQLEDQYQNLMRNYGLPDTYWKRGDLGVQEGFTKLIANDVSPTELENRLQLAKDQIEKGPKEYMDAIKAFYPEINKSDLMAYVLDPTNALKSIQSKVSAAQIGGEYLRAGLLKPEEASAYAGRAAYLAQQGVTAAEARQDIPIIKQAAERGSQLAAFSKQSPYTQATAEEELYNLGGAADAAKRRKQLTELEQSRFLGRTGAGALQRERAGGF